MNEKKIYIHQNHIFSSNTDFKKLTFISQEKISHCSRFLQLKAKTSLGELIQWICNPPASKASMEVADLTERRNPHNPVYGVKEFVCLSVCLSVCDELWPNYPMTGWTKWAKKCKNVAFLDKPKKLFFAKICCKFLSFFSFFA